MLESKKISAILPESWEKSFNIGVVIPVKMRRCYICNGKILCNECNNQVNEIKLFESNLNLLKRDVPNHFGHLFFYFVEYGGLFVMFYWKEFSI